MNRFSLAPLRGLDFSTVLPMVGAVMMLAFQYPGLTRAAEHLESRLEQSSIGSVHLTKHANDSPSQSDQAEPHAIKVLDPLQQLPLLRLGQGWNLHQSLGLPNWFTLGFSAFSQNNGSSEAILKPTLTSSNLFNLALRVGPIAPPSKAINSTNLEAQRGLKPTQSVYKKLAINALLTQRTGLILSDFIPNQLNTQWNFGNGPIGRLGYLNVEYRSEEGLLSMLKLGKLMQAQDFTMNPIQCYFASFTFCGWAQGVPGMIAIPGLPFNSYGAVASFAEGKSVNLRYGMYQIAPDSYAPNLHGFDFSFAHTIGFAHFVEIRIPLKSSSKIPIVLSQTAGVARLASDVPPNYLYESLLPQGTLTLGGWLGHGQFPTVANSTNTQANNNGVYGLVSAKFPGLNLGLDHRLFVAAGLGTTPDVQKFRAGGHAGVVIAGLVPKRPFDTLSVGFGFAAFNADYVMQPTVTPDLIPSTEWSIEFNYSYNINKNISVMPNIQLIVNPSGDYTRSPSWVGGVQVTYAF